MVEIESLSAEKAQTLLPQLAALLRDGVEGGASIGFVLPLPEAEVQEFWAKMIAQVGAGERLLLGAWAEGELVGTAQLEFIGKSNGRHRAEVQKVIVLRRFRGQGIGKQLMLAIEAEARQRGKTLLVLDTDETDVARHLYAKLGFQEVGVIPQYAGTADGTALIGSLFMYKLLGD